MVSDWIPPPPPIFHRALQKRESKFAIIELNDWNDQRDLRNVGGHIDEFPVPATQDEQTLVKTAHFVAQRACENQIAMRDCTNASYS